VTISSVALLLGACTEPFALSPFGDEEVNA
jgi:hypothetical protein